jgi:hypothetical protein
MGMRSAEVSVVDMGIGYGEVELESRGEYVDNLKQKRGTKMTMVVAMKQVARMCDARRIE